MICKKCKAENQEGAGFCNKCGEALPKVAGKMKPWEKYLLHISLILIFVPTLISMAIPSIGHASGNNPVGILGGWITIAGVVLLVIYFKKRAHYKRIKRFEAQRSVLTDEKIRKSWAIMLYDGAGSGEVLTNRIGRAIEKEGIPRLSLTTREISVEGRDRRPFLVAGDSGLKSFEMLFGAYDYGKHLDVRWYAIVDMPDEMGSRELFVEKGKELKNVRRWAKVGDALGYKTGYTLTHRDMEEFQNFMTVVDKIIQEDLELFAKGSKFDFSKDKIKTRGFLTLRDS